MDRSFLFIGGSLDGQVIEVQRGTQTFHNRKFAPQKRRLEDNPSPIATIDYEDEDYKIEPLNTSNREFHFFRYSGLSLDDAIEKLFNNYSPK